MHAVNVDAGFHLARELARQLIAARQPGSFLMLTSLHTSTPRNLPHYSIAKAALIMLVKELARLSGALESGSTLWCRARLPPELSWPTRHWLVTSR